MELIGVADYRSHAYHWQCTSRFLVHDSGLAEVSRVVAAAVDSLVNSDPASSDGKSWSHDHEDDTIGVCLNQEVGKKNILLDRKVGKGNEKRCNAMQSF